MSRVEINTRSPDFEIEDFNGRAVSLSDYQGKQHILLVFNRGFM